MSSCSVFADACASHSIAHAQRRQNVNSCLCAYFSAEFGVNSLLIPYSANCVSLILICIWTFVYIPVLVAYSGTGMPKKQNALGVNYS